MKLEPSRPGTARILFIDLSTKKQLIKQYDETVVRKFIGGYGLAAKIMFDMQKPNENPLGPGNMLGFFTGLLSGTSALVASRFVVVGKSPLTGTWGDSSAGGYFGPTLKAAGFDGVFLPEYPKNPYM